MLCAWVTVALLSGFAPHALAASVTAFVSTSPLEAMRTLIEAGPADCLVSVPLSNPLPPQADRLSDRSAMPPTAQRVRAFLMINLLVAGRLEEPVVKGAAARRRTGAVKGMAVTAERAYGAVRQGEKGVRVRRGGSAARADDEPGRQQDRTGQDGRRLGSRQQFLEHP